MKRNWRWVTTDPERYMDEDPSVVVWGSEEIPFIQSDNVWQSQDDGVAEFLATEFRAIFGMLPDFTKPLKVRFSAEVLPDDTE